MEGLWEQCLGMENSLGASVSGENGMSIECHCLVSNMWKVTRLEKGT